jgi:hypothetical protein
MKVFYLNSIFWITLIIAFLNSCSSNTNADDANKTEEELKVPDAILASTKEVFKTLPSPVETAKLIYKANVRFDEKILNPIQNVPYYITSQSMALNFGIYSADLSFSSMFDQTQVTLDYFNAVQTLADGLGLVHLVKQEDIIKLEDNLYNKDSIKIMVEDLIFNSGEFLNDNNRPEIALLVVVGGWIEGMYIAMQMAKQSGHINKELVDRMVEQYNSLLLVIKALDGFKKLSVIEGVLGDMNRLKTIYDKMIVTDNKDVKKNITNLAQNAKANVTPDLFLSLYQEILKIRNGYTQ